jgi:hypothetical protein
MSPLAPDSNSSFLPQTLEDVLLRSPPRRSSRLPVDAHGQHQGEYNGDSGERFTGVVVPANVTVTAASAADG